MVSGTPKVENAAKGPAGETVFRRTLRWIGMMTTGRFAEVAMTFTSTVVLARILTTEEFGIASIVISFLIVLRVFAGGEAFEEALTQRKVLKRAHLNTVLAVSWMLGAAILALCLIAGRTAGSAFGDPRFWDLAALASLALFGGAVESTQTAVARRRRKFDSIARAQIFGALSSGICGVGLGLAGAGPFALVGARVAWSITIASYLTLSSAVRIVPIFSISHLRDIARYSGWSLGPRLASASAYLIPNMFLAAFASVTAVGYLSMALRLAEPLRGIARSIGHNIAFSFFIRAQSNHAELERVFLSSIGIMALITAPAFFGIAAIADMFLAFAIGPNWGPSVPIVQLLVIGSALLAPIDLASTALNARGAPEHMFTQRLIGVIALTAALWVTSAAGLGGVGAGLARAIADVCEGGYALLAQRLFLNVPARRSLRALAVPYAAATAMALAVLQVGALLGTAPLVLRLPVSVTVGVAVYTVLIALFSSQARDLGRTGLRSIGFRTI